MKKENPLFKGAEIIFKGIKIPRIKWYMRIPLFFCKTIVGIDGNFFMKAKILFGHTYIVDWGESKEANREKMF